MFTSKDLALIAILSAAGGALSVPVGHLSSFLNGIPGIPFGTPQLLSGIHVLWMILAGLLIKQRGATAMTGALKGLVELALFSFHGILILPIAGAEGLVAEATFLVLGRKTEYLVYIAGGLSSSANVIVLRMLVLQALPWQLIVFIWVLSFTSGVVIAGYFGNKVVKIVDKRRIHK